MNSAATMYGNVSAISPCFGLSPYVRSPSAPQMRADTVQLKLFRQEGFAMQVAIFEKAWVIASIFVL